jgi:hypothetical protein
MKHLTFLLAFIVVVASSHANASVTVMWTPDPTLMDGQPVNVAAQFTTGTDSITVLVHNIQVNPTSVVQNLSGLRFTVSTGETAGTLVSSSGVPRSVAKTGGAYTDGPADSTGWELGTIGPEMYLHVLDTGPGGVGPAHLIIGRPDASDEYSNANGSIADNGPHNPFLSGINMFELSVLGVTDASTITEATFEFGTSSGYEVTVVPDQVTPFPEPATMSLLCVGAVAMLRRKRQK